MVSPELTRACMSDCQGAPPFVVAPIQNQQAVVGQHFELVVPADTFASNQSDTSDLLVTGAVSIAAGGARGGAVGISVTAGLAGVATVAGTSTLVAGAVLRVTLTCTDIVGGGSASLQFSITVTGA